MKLLQVLGPGCPKCKKLAENAEAAGLRHSGHQFGLRHPHHSSLDDRMLDSQGFGNPGLEDLLHNLPSFPVFPAPAYSVDDSLLRRRGAVFRRAAPARRLEGAARRV